MDWFGWPHVVGLALVTCGALLSVLTIKTTINLDLLEYLKYRESKRILDVQKRCDHVLIASDIPTYCQECDKTFTPDEETRYRQKTCPHMDCDVVGGNHSATEFKCFDCGIRYYGG